MSSAFGKLSKSKAMSNKRTQKYRFDLEEMYPWVRQSDSDKSKGFCKYCKSDIISNKDFYKDHQKSKRHQGFFIEAPKILKINQLCSDSTIKTAEIKTCAFICEQNQAMLSLDNLTNLFNHIFPDSKISKYVFLLKDEREVEIAYEVCERISRENISKEIKKERTNIESFWTNLY